jgi:hypothetical protein
MRESRRRGRKKKPRTREKGDEMKERQLRPEALAILAKCHVSKGRLPISELVEWSGFSKEEVENLIRYELSGLCVIDGDDAVGKIGKEKAVKSCHRIPCPHEKIVNLWNELTKGVLPRVNVWEQGSERYRNLAARWTTTMELLEKNGKQASEMEGLATFVKIIRYILSTQFLTGRVNGRDGRPPFKATLEFFAQSKSFQNIVDRKYK